MDDSLLAARFPRSSKYNQDWLLSSISGAANPLWLTEWLISAIPLRPGMRVLDLGCGRATSSIFLHFEAGVQVWATDLWFSVSENLQRIRDAGADTHVFPTYSDARSLPFAVEFFDVILSIDSFVYYGTDDLYLNYLARFLRPGGYIGIAGAGLTREFEGPVPQHLLKWWTPDLNCLHSAEWWRRHWTRSGVVDVELADCMPDGWCLWLDWHKIIAPGNSSEIQALEADKGETLAYFRVLARRRQIIDLSEQTKEIATLYKKKLMLPT